MPVVEKKPVVVVSEHLTEVKLNVKTLKGDVKGLKQDIKELKELKKKPKVSKIGISNDAFAPYFHIFDFSPVLYRRINTQYIFLKNSKTAMEPPTLESNVFCGK